MKIYILSNNNKKKHKTKLNLFFKSSKLKFQKSLIEKKSKKNHIHLSNKPYYGRNLYHIQQIFISYMSLENTVKCNSLKNVLS